MVDWTKHDALIAELRDEQRKLQSAIDALETLRPSSIVAQAFAAPTPPAGPWANVATADAAKHVLQENADRVWSVGDLFRILEGNGVNVASANILSSILSRRAKERGDIFRVGRGMWAGDSPAARRMADSILSERPDEDDDL